MAIDEKKTYKLSDFENTILEDFRKDIIYATILSRLANSNAWNDGLYDIWAKNDMNYEEMKIDEMYNFIADRNYKKLIDNVKEDLIEWNFVFEFDEEINTIYINPNTPKNYLAECNSSVNFSIDIVTYKRFMNEKE